MDEKLSDISLYIKSVYPRVVTDTNPKLGDAIHYIIYYADETGGFQIRIEKVDLLKGIEESIGPIKDTKWDSYRNTLKINIRRFELW